MDGLFGRRESEAPPDLGALRRPLADGVELDLAFAWPLLEGYAEAPGHAGIGLRLERVWALPAGGGGDGAGGPGRPGHGRVRPCWPARPCGTWPRVYGKPGRWLAEAFDLRLSPRVRPDPGGRELTGRLMFLDPALGSALQERRIWLGDIAGIGRRVAQAPVTFRDSGSDRVPGPTGRATVAEALRGHLEELDGFLRAVAAAIERYASAGGRPREEPDEAWLND